MQTSARLLTLVSVVALATGPAARRADADFAFRDRDTVVFLGDSNTFAGGYAKVVERYTRLRFPKLGVGFVNAGVSGDTAQTGLARFRRDVLDAGATAVVVVFGVNDLCWGDCADDAHEEAYLNGIRGIVTASIQAGIRAYVCTYPPVGDPYTGDTSVLQSMTDAGVALA